MKTKQELMKATSKYAFKNEMKDDKVVLTLSGPVAQSSIFADETINSQDIAEALDGVDKDIVIRLNSPGGDAFQGIEIYNYLKTTLHTLQLKLLLWLQVRHLSLQWRPMSSL